MPNFMMMVHKEHCTTCQSYVKNVVDMSKDTTIPILHPQITSKFFSTWPQSVATTEDEVTVEAYCKCIWYSDHYNNWDRRAKISEEKISSKKEHPHKAEVDLEASRSREAELEKELKELQWELKSKGKCKMSPEHYQPMTHKFHKWESMTNSDITEDTSLSRLS